MVLTINTVKSRKEKSSNNKRWYIGHEDIKYKEKKKISPLHTRQEKKNIKA